MGKRLKMPMSKLVVWGPKSELRPESPKRQTGQAQRVCCGIEEERALRTVLILRSCDVAPADLGHKIDVGAGALAIGDAGVIAIPAVDHAERLAGLELGDTRPLPAAEGELREMAVAFELGQRVDVADVEDMPLIEVGTGAVGLEIVAVDEVAIVAIGFVVDRVAVRVGQGKFQIGCGAAR